MCLVLAGCTGEFQPDVVLDVDASPQLAEAAHYAADQWRQACGYDVRFASGGVRVGFATLDHAKAGTQYPDHIDITTYIDNNPYMLRLVLMHEIGHSLGLHHTDHGVMQPVVDMTYDRLDSSDCQW